MEYLGLKNELQKTAEVLEQKQTDIKSHQQNQTKQEDLTINNMNSIKQEGTTLISRY